MYNSMITSITNKPSLIEEMSALQFAEVGEIDCFRIASISSDETLLFCHWAADDRSEMASVLGPHVLSLAQENGYLTPNQTYFELIIGDLSARSRIGRIEQSLAALELGKLVRNI
jgi:hypothetical protein